MLRSVNSLRLQIITRVQYGYKAYKVVLYNGSDTYTIYLIFLSYQYQMALNICCDGFERGVGFKS